MQQTVWMHTILEKKTFAILKNCFYTIVNVNVVCFSRSPAEIYIYVACVYVSTYYTVNK